VLAPLSALGGFKNTPESWDLWLGGREAAVDQVIGTCLFGVLETVTESDARNHN
jgi:hypothetical protein